MRALTNFKLLSEKKLFIMIMMAMIVTTCKSTCIIKLRITDLLLLYIKNVNTGSSAFRNINLFLSLFPFYAGIRCIRMELSRIRL